MTFRAEETVPAAADAVWRHLSLPELMSGWMPGVDGMRTEDGGPVETGSTLVFEARGKRHTSEVLECKPAQALVLRSTQGAFTATYRYRLEPDGGHCRVVLEAECRARGPARLLVPLVGRLMKASDRRHPGAIRAAVERQA